MRRLRLLPEDSREGWTPYAWLIYLATFFIEPVIRTRHGTASTGYWLVTLLGVIVFLVSYFAGYWVKGRRRILVVLFQTMLGVVFAPINTGSSVFFVYAASFAGFVNPQRVAVRLVPAVAAVGALTAWFSGAPLFYWIVATVIALLVGGVNLHTAGQYRADSKLRLAHAQIEHLATIAERERIARDLHDVLGHTLSMIVLKAELAGKIIDGDPARAAAEMGDVESVARRTLQDVREAIRGYRPTLADEVARAVALLTTAGVEADVHIEPPSLTQEQEQALALAVREAATNVVRHAAATRCSIRLRVDGDAVHLDIQDNGRGGNATEGGGLRGMRERIEACGGRVQTALERGMHLHISMPVTA
jgi:two-component system, NarL family, sensor histidine kinase DesK